LIEEHNIRDWVNDVPEGDQRQFREAIHIILSGIANQPALKSSMVIKGGILLAIRYNSHRYTRDIDFSTNQMLGDINKDEIANRLNKSIAIMGESLDYDLECKIQSCKVQPANKSDTQFPSIKMKIGYAYKHEQKYKRLLAGRCPTAIDIDYSLNELMPNIDEFSIGGDGILTAYTLIDLIAEKIRSVLQQLKRGRHRRQDVFDLFLLIEKFPDLDAVVKAKILDSLIVKAHSRGIYPQAESFRDEEIRKRSKAEYPTLADEIVGDLPDFDLIYPVVQSFYESLPWEQLE